MSNPANIAKDKMLYYGERVFGDHRPITADIFLTNYCNNNCPYCTYRRWELEPGARAMAFEEFKAYAERLRGLGVLGMILTGGGEPTLAPDFEKITAWLEQEGIHYGINTNFNVLRLCRPDYLKVSLDGYDEDSYEEARGVRAYARVRENIRQYADWKLTHSPATSLGVQKMVESAEDAVRFYEANKDLPVDYMVFRPMESTAGTYYLGPGPWEEKGRIIDMIKGLAEKDRRVVLNFKWELLSMRQERCTAAWAQIALNERGEVMYCCQKPYEVVGHVMDEDILEKKAAAVTNMCDCDIPCRMSGPNAAVAAMEERIKDAYFI